MTDPKSMVDARSSDPSMIFNSAIREYFLTVFRRMLGEPRHAIFLLKTLYRQGRAARLRGRFKKQGLTVPPMLIISVTDQCNFSCAGCYRKAQGPVTAAKLSTEELNGVLRQASDLGISLVLLAGGEPLLRKDLFEVIGNFPAIIFLVKVLVLFMKFLYGFEKIGLILGC